MLLALFRLFASLPRPRMHRPPGRTAGLCLPGKYRRRLQANAAQAGYPDPAFARRAAAGRRHDPGNAPVWFRNEQSLAQVVSDDNEVVAAARSRTAASCS